MVTEANGVEYKSEFAQNRTRMCLGIAQRSDRREEDLKDHGHWRWEKV